MDDFFIVLPSNASRDLFPDNKRSTFKVRLPQIQNLTPNWVVGMTEMSYTFSWYNLNSLDHRFKVTDPSFYDVGEIDKEFKIPGSYYDSPTSLINVMNKLLEDKVNSRAKVTKPSEFGLSPEMKLIMKKTGTFMHTDPTTGALEDAPIEFKYTPEFKHILGHDGKGFNNPINLNQEYTSLYVYCDAVYPTIIGDTMGNLLRVVTVDSSVPFGTTVTKIFEEPYYMKLANHSFQALSVYIRTDTGKPPHFEFGRVVVTLHFKRQQ